MVTKTQQVAKVATPTSHNETRRALNRKTPQAKAAAAAKL